MDVQQIEAMAVMGAAASVGAMFAFLDPDRMPGALGYWAKRLGAYRKVVGIAIILCAIGFVVGRTATAR